MRVHPSAVVIHAVALLLACVYDGSVVRAEHAVIELNLIGPKGQADAKSDQEPPFGGINPRPRLTVKAGDAVVLQYVLTNVYPHGVIKDVTVRYFVVRTNKIRQKTIPPLKAKKDVITEAEIQQTVVMQGVVVMNLTPKCRVGARVRFRVSKPGIYLVRIDTLNTKSDHEHFSAIDLEVK